MVKRSLINKSFGDIHDIHGRSDGSTEEIECPSAARSEGWSSLVPPSVCRWAIYPLAADQMPEMPR